MRKLTIKRHKRSAGCLSKVKVYIEDPNSSELDINDTPCRKLGVLKNGEEKTFEIENDARKIFIIGDKASRNFINEFYRIEAGEDDIFLSGGCKFDISRGNMFLFDGNEHNAEVQENRKRGRRKYCLILLGAVVVGVVAGIITGLLNAGASKPKTFTVGDMSITLTREFSEMDIDGFDAAYASSDVAVFVLIEPFVSAPGFENYTLKEYGELIMDVNNVQAQLETKDGLTYFKYDSYIEEEGEQYSYVSFIFKADDAFWMVQFAVEQDRSSSYADRIIEWAGTVEFN